MKTLIKKELKLVIMPVVYMMALTGALLLIPSYPYAVSTSYCLLSIFITFNTAAINKDHEFTSMLPVPRKSVVLTKHIDVVFIELLQVVVMIPFALLSSLVLWKQGNIVGLDANLTFFGIAFLALSVFNIIFLPWFFKTGHKTGWPMLCGLVGYLGVILFSEVLIAVVPILHSTLDGLNTSTFVWQLIPLILGIIAYITTIVISYRLSIKNFKRVSL